MNTIGCSPQAKCGLLCFQASRYNVSPANLLVIQGYWQHRSTGRRFFLNAASVQALFESDSDASPGGKNKEVQVPQDSEDAETAQEDEAIEEAGLTAPKQSSTKGMSGKAQALSACGIFCTESCSRKYRHFFLVFRTA